MVVPKKILLIFGTRPEAIKMAPVVSELSRYPDKFIIQTCVTGQHREMLVPILNFFKITPTFSLDLMVSGQSLASFTAKAITAISDVLVQVQPDLVLVQGDTTTAFVGALAAFYARIPVGHIEAGLRSENKYSPFPEELNRKLIAPIADLHFAPTKRAVESLKLEGITKQVYEVTNTCIDALFMGLGIISVESQEAASLRSRIEKHFANIDLTKRLILVTGHRRESFGKGFENICRAIRGIAEKTTDVEVVFPVHLNPNVREPVQRILSGFSRVHLIEPLDYPEMIWLMSRSYLVLTDSGGVQEEAPSLGKPVLVMREVTERKEGIEAGSAVLVGTEQAQIEEKCLRLLNNADEYNKMASVRNPYGDGKAAGRIVDVLKNFFKF
jgi:UDP-N-acetylglucosamine 2-epimerase (non-hydrolysing)